jgi:hypothetical protein
LEIEIPVIVNPLAVTVFPDDAVVMFSVDAPVLVKAMF